MIKDALSSIDLFGTPIAVSFSGKEKYRSKYGGSCSLLVLGFVIWAIYNASQELFTNKNPKVTTSETYTDNPRELTLTRDNFPVAFGLQAPDSKNFTIFKNDSIYKFQIIQVMFNRTILEDGTLKEDIQITNVPTENCTPGHFGELASSFTSLDLRNMYCIARDSNSDYKEVKIVGVGESLFYRGFTVQVSQCINATNSTTEGNCATQPVIDSWLAGSWLNAYYGNMVVDGQNYSRPDSRYRDRYYTMISPANYVYATIYLGRVEVSTDSGWLASNTKKKEYIQIDKIDDYLQTGSRDDKILIHVNFETSKLEKTYARSYKKLQNVLAEVAALANIALIVVFLLLAPYSRLKFRETLINELFDFQENNTPKNSKKVIKGIMKKSHYINTLEMQPTESLQSEPRVSTKPTKKELYIKTSIPMSTEAAETIQFRSMDSSPGIFEKKTRFELPEDDASSKKDSFTLSPRNLSLIEPKIKTKKTIAQRRQEFKRLSHFSHSNRMRKSVRMAASLPTIHIKSKKSIIDTMSTYQSFQRTESQFGPVSGAFSNKLNSKKPESKALEELEDDNMKDVNYDEQIDNVDHVDNDEEDLNVKQHTTERNLLTEERITHINRNNTIFLHGKRKASPRYGRKYEEADDEADEKVFSEEEQEAEHRIFIKTGQEPEKINLSIGEYLMSFLYRPPKLKRKMKILSEGVKNINDRLDILNLLKKVREIDKLKALLLDHDQLLLFNLLPKPKLKQEKGNDGPRSSFSLEQLREPKFIEESKKEDALRESYKRIKRKNYKTDIDRKLLETIEALRNDI